MRLGRRPGAYVALVDSFTQETLLKAECDTNNVDLISFRLYDSSGGLVADSDGPQTYPDGVEILAGAGEELLHVPSVRDQSIRYRIYSTQGTLLTCSDGLRTLIYGGVHVEGNKHLPGRPPGSAEIAAAKTRDAGPEQNGVQS